MPKRGENIYKRKDGRWEGRYKNTIPTALSNGVMCTQKPIEKSGRNCKRSMVLPVSLLNKTSK